MKISIFEIKIGQGRREADPEAVHKLADSISEIGLVNPITVDQDYTLIAGLHRLEAAKMLGWTEIECTVSDLEGLQAELAELDENFVRKELSNDEVRELLLRRKEIYERLHPETKATYDGGAFRGNQHQKVVTDKMSATTKSFVQDTADKWGVAPRTVWREIQTAKNLTQEAKDIIKETKTKITKADTMKLSRLPPEQQGEAAAQLASGDIQSVDQYRPTLATPNEIAPEPEMPQAPEQAEPVSPTPAPPSASPASEGYYPTIKDSVADLKNPNKDRRCTPDSFLTTFFYFLERFCKSMEGYTGPEYDAVFPVLTQEHLGQIHQKIQAVHSALDKLSDKIERKAQNEAT